MDVGEEIDRPGEGQIRMTRAQHRARRGRGVLRQDHSGCRSPAERRRVLGVGHEREVARAGTLDARDADDIDAAVPFQSPFEASRNLTELQEPQYMTGSGARWWRVPRHGPPRCYHPGV